MNDTEFLKSTGAKLKRMRKASGVTMKDIHEAGITTAYNVCQIENGRRNVRLLTLKKIADLIGVDIKSLL